MQDPRTYLQDLLLEVVAGLDVARRQGDRQAEDEHGPDSVQSDILK